MADPFAIAHLDRGDRTVERVPQTWGWSPTWQVQRARDHWISCVSMWKGRVYSEDSVLAGEGRCHWTENDESCDNWKRDHHVKVMVALTMLEVPPPRFRSRGLGRGNLRDPI